METAQTFLTANTHDRLTMARDDGNEAALTRLLGEAPTTSCGALADQWFSGTHLAPDDPKNLIFVPGIMGSLLMNSAKAGIWWIDVRTRDFIDSLGLAPDGIAEADPENMIAPVTADPSYTPFLSVALKQQGSTTRSFPTTGASPCCRARRPCETS